ncbi:hypothetical protein C0J08_07665 [Marinomonas sp. CT5]|uniref:hypothetical protein n=1 Tax=Marinomonas sp. CT5 TaxID=2066133 RepID=UPI001BAF99FD|nr:hypothetical protein [Marinomonas sp. CT5]QUX95304.1 hypothetical protein C0J08_07665 [Marinomonas sp. CT5]
MKTLLSTCVSVPVLLFSSMLIAQDSTEAPACEVKDMTSVSYMENLQPNSDIDVGEIYKAKTEELIAFAEKYNLEDFQIVNQDASVSANCCGNYGSQINMNYTVTYKPSYSAFTAFHKYGGTGMVSTYRIGLENCPTDK